MSLIWWKRVCILRRHHPVHEKLTRISEYLMSTPVVLFLKSEFKNGIAQSGSDEYKAFHTIVFSTIYRCLWILLLWTECIYVHLNNNTFIVTGIPETHNELEINYCLTSIMQDLFENAVMQHLAHAACSTV